MLKAIGYVRVSTTGQAESGWGLPAQRARIKDEAKRRKWKLLEIVSDGGKSGKDLKRPGIARALQILEDGEADVLVVAKLDRFTRSLLDFAATMAVSREQGWQFVALDLGVDTSTPAGALMTNIVASFAEYERELISVRVREALAAAKAAGTILGRPSGIPADILSRIKREVAEGRPLRAIARGLNEDGVPTAQGGKKWYASTIKRVTMKRPPGGD